MEHLVRLLFNIYIYIYTYFSDSKWFHCVGEIFKCKWRGTLVAAKCIKSAKIHQEWAFKNNGTQASLLDEEARKQAIEDFRLEIDILKQIR